MAGSWTLDTGASNTGDSNTGDSKRNVCMNNSTRVLTGKGGLGPMESVIWFAGIILFYFAMQLWILPRLGIAT
jgi:hypothetical protein